MGVFGSTHVLLFYNPPEANGEMLTAFCGEPKSVS